MGSSLLCLFIIDSGKRFVFAHVWLFETIMLYDSVVTKWLAMVTPLALSVSPRRTKLPKSRGLLFKRIKTLGRLM